MRLVLQHALVLLAKHDLRRMLHWLCTSCPVVARVAHLVSAPILVVGGFIVFPPACDAGCCGRSPSVPAMGCRRSNSSGRARWCAR